jgi:hypothetical protein
MKRKRKRKKKAKWGNGEAPQAKARGASKWGWEFATLSFPMADLRRSCFGHGGQLPDAVCHGKRHSIRSRSRTGRWLSLASILSEAS